MSSLPPRQPGQHVDPHNLTTAQNIKTASANVNRFAKRDPALYPLSIIVVGALGVAGYFFMKKGTEPEAHKKLMSGGVVNPWDDTNKHDTHPSSVAAFKYRHKTREGHYEDSLPTLNEQTVSLKDIPRKFPAA